VLGGLLAVLDWRAVFWINVPVGVFGTIWAYRMLRESGERHRARIDWWGNVLFAGGLSAILVGVTQGIQPSGTDAMSWTAAPVLALLIGGVAVLVAFVFVEHRVRDAMFDLDLFRIREFTAGNIAAFIGATARGGLQFVLIIWLQGIWLPLHGYDYSATPLFAGIYLLPMTGAFLFSGPIAGWLSDRHGARLLATSGMLTFGASFVGLLALPVDFPYWAFAVLITLNGLGVGIFSSPNAASIMSSVPARHRGAASGMRSTFQNSGTAISIGAFFSLMIAGLAATLPATLTRGLTQQGVPAAVAHHVASLPPVSSLFSAILGENPIGHLLSHGGTLATLPPAAQQTLTGRQFFPDLIAGPFHSGLVIVFATAAALSLIAAIAASLRGPGSRRHALTSTVA
jgi:MFS family permease